MKGQAVSILIIDDDDVDIRLVKRGLSKYRIDNPIYEAFDGVDALEKLRGQDGQSKIKSPCLILLDLNMPRMTGHEFLTELRNDPELSDSIVFVLTTSSDEVDMSKAYAKHVAGYLLKSEAGRDFVNHLPLLEEFITTVKFPAAKRSPQPELIA